MRYLRSPSTDPRFNLALEQYVFDCLPREQDYFMLWQNENAVVVGKHQNTFAEVDADYVRSHGIRVVRRLSGGGAVYHDLGNINFTFIADHEGPRFDFAAFCRPIAAALESFGVHVEVNGRNDMTIQGKKFSGNSQYIKDGRVMHHGTILYDSDLNVVQNALRASRDKLVSKGLPSVRSRVTNVKPHLPQPVSTQVFLERLENFMTATYGLEGYVLTEGDICAVRQIQAEVYNNWEWNFGASPECQMEKHRRVEGCGELQFHMDVENGVIQTLVICGDYFGRKDTKQLTERLTGVKLEEEAVRAVLAGLDVGDYFQNLDLDTFCALLLQ